MQSCCNAKDTLIPPLKYVMSYIKLNIKLETIPDKFTFIHLQTVCKRSFNDEFHHYPKAHKRLTTELYRKVLPKTCLLKRYRPERPDENDKPLMSPLTLPTTVQRINVTVPLPAPSINVGSNNCGAAALGECPG